jgi:hypothetical protein
MTILLLTAGFVAVTALLGWTRFAEGITHWLLGAYVLAFAEIVVVSLALSLASAFTRWALLAAVLALFGPVAATQRPRLPPLRPAVQAAVQVLRDPAVAALGLLALAVAAYSVALGLFTPPNDEDALAYHLARAAFWWQQEQVGGIEGAADARMTDWAPNSEIAMAFTMVASGSGRFVPLLQLVAAAAGALGAYGVARRLGLGVREGVVGALLFFTAPIVALQASTALNDVIVASLVVCAAFFLLGVSRAELVLAGVAVALLVGTKLTGVIALPGLALLALLARRFRPLHVLAVLAVSAALGCYWYAVNLASGRDFFGGVRGEGVGLDVVAAIARVLRLALASIELPGAVGLDRLLYVAAAGLLALLAFRTRGSVRARGIRAAVAAGATLLPLVLVPLDRLLVRASQKILGEVAYLDPDRSATKASTLFSWYGPAGALLTVLACVVVVRAVRRGRLPAVALAVAAAPVLWVVLVGIGVPYWEWNGRYAMGGFAVGAAAWGLVARFPPLLWATAAVAVLSTSLAFVHLHERPSGLRLLEPTDETSVWTQPDWAVQATDNPHLRAVYRFVEERVPWDAHVAVEPNVWPGGTNAGGNMQPYPFFGPDLSRTVSLADTADEARAAGADWAVLRDARREPCSPGWRLSFRYGLWVVLRRDPDAACP